jgi:hypothetical protein
VGNPLVARRAATSQRPPHRRRVARRRAAAGSIAPFHASRLSHELQVPTRLGASWCVPAGLRRPTGRGPCRP